MSDMTTEAKCVCQRCGQPIAFPVAMHNEETKCPHCGKMTTLDARQVRKAEMQPAPVDYPSDPRIPTQGIVIAGYALAILMPLIGFFIGLYLLTTKRQSSGVAIMALSVICFLVWYAIITS